MRELGALLVVWAATMYTLEVLLHFLLSVLLPNLREGVRGRIDQVSVSLVAAAVLLAWLLRNRFPLGAPLALAVLGRWLALACTVSFLFRGGDARQGLLLVAGVVTCILGLWRALGSAPGSYAGRAVFAIGGFVLPGILAQMTVGMPRFRGNWIAISLLLTLALSAAAVLLRRGATATPLPGLRQAVVAVLAGVIAGTGFAPIRNQLAQHRRAEVRRAVEAIPARPPRQNWPRDWFHRGVNFTANRYSYESSQAKRLLGEMPRYGVTDVAIVPYGFYGQGSSRIMTARDGSWESDSGVRLLAAEAHRLGMRVMLKPHVWSPREPEMRTPEQRRQWLSEYSGFVEHYARLASNIQADLFCVGVEFAALTGEEAEWRRLIGLARKHYPGALVYAATQGPEFESIRFWDALDYIGLDNYYPLGHGYSTADMMARIEAVQKRFRKPVLFTEAGYSSSPGAALTPWDDRRSGPVSLEEQVRCYEALYQAFHSKTWFRGVYWWKIETDETGGADHPGMPPWGKPAMEVIRRWNSKRPAAP